MMSYELAIDEEGEPFPVPPQVAGWRVRRASEGRGRPSLVHDKGKPLVVRASASHAELLAAAGPGKYRLEAVDEHWHRVEGVPTACTGPLSADDDGLRNDDSSGEFNGGPPVRQVSSVEDMLCQVVTANTRIVEKAISQMSAVMTGVAEVLNAAHNAGVTNRTPPPAPPPLPPQDDDQEAASSFGMSQVVQLLIKEAVDKAIPLIIGRIANGGAVGGIPVEAFLDWRKAAPNPAPTTAPPSARPAPASSSSWPESATTAPSAAAPTSAPAGAAPSHESPGAAPAEGPAHAAPPPSQEATAAMVNAHVLQVWQGLSPPERSRATQLVTRLTPAERAAWLAELATLTVPEAIARARHIIGQPASTPPTPPIPPLPTPAPEGS